MKENRKIVATIEARMTSSRLPGKVLMEMCGKPALQHMIERLRQSTCVDEIVVATTINETDDPIVELCKNLECSFYRGSEEDVLLRVLDAAKSVQGDIIVETTGDCPIIDWRYVDEAINLYLSGDYDYVSNCLNRTFPIGFDVQVFSQTLLNEVNEISKDPLDHEHVSLYIYQHPEKYNLKSMPARGKLCRPELEFTLDTKEDYILLNQIFESLYPYNNDFTAEDVIELVDQNPTMMKIVEAVKRTEVG